MSWNAQQLVSGYNCIIYAQAAGTGTAPGSGDEVPWGTGFSISSERETTESGPWINYNAKKKSPGAISSSGSLTVSQAAATSTVRALLIAASIGTSKIKFTILIGGTNGDKYVFDQAVLSQSFEVDPSGASIDHTFDWESDPVVYTAGTYA